MLSFLGFAYFPLHGIVSANSLCEKDKSTFFIETASSEKAIYWKKTKHKKYNYKKCIISKCYDEQSSILISLLSESSSSSMSK